ncbi:hypothetical protein BK138_22775 [Paenibacillus rhizosphaerae]|uniref:Cell envelope-related transcriptional attenuator domain-containing protein n=1 Tax=Paenibacillus rhizosphaerae TaxID=297318 RepID=A0A1R1EKC0_9BACL|nr:MULTISPECIES: LCP family protein [Paenibacillus]OMF52268.1 hypothetical protein BK138_22775 [Paenibacillus rhizosphaerae]RED35035.1 LytR family transcriptional attenuator [Paenibacillus sp. VMFN-D1]
MQPRSKKKKKMSRLRKWMLSITAVIALLLIGVGGFLGFLHHKAISTLHKISAAAEYYAPQSQQQEQGEAVSEPPVESVTEADMKPMTFLLAGIDNREGSGGTINTDVMILGALNPEKKSASLISIPRDLKISQSQLGTHKANYYYAHYYIKDKKAAMADTKEFFGDLFHIPVDYMVMINFEGFRQIIDAVGGVDVDVDMDMRYKDTADGTDINLRKGMQHLDGKQALDFVRYRKSNDGSSPSSDFDRNRRQQQVLNQVLDKLTSFKGISQWGQVLDIIGEQVQTDIPAKNMERWLLNYKKMKPDQIQMQTVEGQWKSPYVYWNEQQLKEALTVLAGELDQKPKRLSTLGNRIGLYSGE